MTKITTAKFEKHTQDIFHQLHEQNEEYVVTERGKPLALIIPVTTNEQVEDIVLSTHSTFVQQRQRSRIEIEMGETVGMKELQAL